MRCEFAKLQKHNSKKAERIILELLKRNHLPFRTKWIIAGHEVDFLVKKTIIEIDGAIHLHLKSQRDILFTRLGYKPIHFSVNEIKKNISLTEKKLKYLVK